MKDIKNKVIKFFDTRNIIIGVLILILIFGGNFMINQSRRQNQKITSEIKLREALQDSVKTYKNKNGELVSEKLTIQGDLKELEKKNLTLTENQKELFDRLQKSENKNRIFSAALIDAEFLIDSLDNLVASASEIDTVNNTISFVEDSAKWINYDVTITEVKPVGNPELVLNFLSLPNKQFVKFQFDDDKQKDYPISFSVTNTNPYYKVNDIDSYTIPTIQKQTVQPTGFQKVWKWVKRNGKFVLIGAGGFTVGYLVAQ